MKLSTTALSLAIISTYFAVRACYTTMFIVSRVLTDDPRSKFTKMTIILLAPSDINNHSATVDSGNTSKTVITAASNGTVLFAALRRDETFRLYYNGWHNFHGHGKRRRSAAGDSAENIDFDGCTN